MATLVLAAAGAWAGSSLLGAVGALAGRAAGAIVGGFLDNLLFGRKQEAEGPRLEDLRVSASTEGAPIPRLYGTARIGGQIIWATRLEEEKITRTSGGKGGGPKVKSTEYLYHANLAVGLCEGEVAAVTRIWADGKPLDLSQLTWRLHRGTEDQQPDPLVIARQGVAPAYRGLAHVVFERLPLKRFGNRIPQLTFEVVRPVDATLKDIPAVNIIPGAGEFFCDTLPVRRLAAPGESAAENIHMDGEETDWSVSLNQLQALAPGLRAAALVVGWFGTDLRCGHCDVLPAVDDRAKQTRPESWAVAGYTRATARLVSRREGRPAFGGTPSDASVIRAIRDMKARGIAPVFYPFLFMDIPAANSLPDPRGGTAQPAWPWRGRITCHPAPGRPGSPDGTSAVNAQVDAFAARYRAFILHYARLCAEAGGVEAFLIGSELRGLTTLRDGPASYPFVRALKALAAEVRAILPGAKVSYAADWSEWFGHHPGSGELFFHLDPLWSDDNIDFIGIDNYMPLADWREGLDHRDARAGAGSICDPDYLKGNIAGGEGYDWHYASEGDRAAQVRTPITDGAYGKPWVWRCKDLKSWWENAHFDRPGGVESATPTSWRPRSKPFWFTELGCPAVDKGANQSNVFFDPKSSESRLPHHSSGARDDAVQRAFIAAHLEYWRESGPHNPVSDVYGGPMVEPSRIFLWAWDARPWPAWPALRDVWSDGANHELGHWLNGRLGQAPVGELIRAICADHGFAALEVEEPGFMITGYVIDRPMSARAALEPLLKLFSMDAVASGARVCFRRRQRRPVATITAASFVEGEGDAPLCEITRAEAGELPVEVRIHYMDADAAHRAAVAGARHHGADPSRRVEDVPSACVMRQPLAAARAEVLLREARASRESLRISLPPQMAALEPGDILSISLREGAASRQWRIERITDDTARHLHLRAFDPAAFSAPALPAPPPRERFAPVFGAPLVLPLDIPSLREDDLSPRLLLAAHAAPWPGAVDVQRKVAGSWEPAATITARAAIGELLEPLPPPPAMRQWLFDRASVLLVRMFHGQLSSVTAEALFAGANAAAVGSVQGSWEIIQFRDAELVDRNTWRLSTLLRGQRGSGPEIGSGHAAGSFFVLLDEALVPLPLGAADIGRAIALSCGPAGTPRGGDCWAETSVPFRGLVARPFRPVHLRASRRPGGDIAFRWKRRSRSPAADAWGVADAPLAESLERWRLQIMDGSTVRRTIVSDRPHALWPVARQAADFPSGLPRPLIVRLSQFSETFGHGAEITEALHV